jgi:hypothetical protein
MKKPVLYAILALAALLQVGLVLSMILRHERTLEQGTPVRFAAAPYDPVAPFKGRYVQLRLDAGNFRGDAAIAQGQPIYAVLDVDAEGFATINRLQTEKPGSDVRYITVKEWHAYFGSCFPEEEMTTVSLPAKNEQTAIPYYLTLPFDRYYMNEKAAPEAEKAFQKATQRRLDANSNRIPPDPKKNYVIVRLLDGDAVAESLVIDGKPVEELLRGSR